MSRAPCFGVEPIKVPALPIPQSLCCPPPSSAEHAWSSVELHIGWRYERPSGLLRLAPNPLQVSSSFSAAPAPLSTLRQGCTHSQRAAHVSIHPAPTPAFFSHKFAPGSHDRMSALHGAAASLHLHFMLCISERSHSMAAALLMALVASLLQLTSHSSG